MTSPGVTLTGTLTDTQGNPVAGTVTLTLANYGPYLPVLTGSNVCAQLIVSATANASGVFSMTFYGNYQITPSNTYYEVTIQIPGYAGTATASTQSAAYSFGTSGTFDLSNLTPLAAYYPVTPPIPAFPVPVTYSTVTYSATPSFAGNSAAAINVFDITLTGNVTSSTISGLQAGSIVQFIIRQNATGGYTFAWPSNVNNPPSVNTVASSKSTANFMVDSSGNLYPQIGWS